MDAFIGAPKFIELEESCEKIQKYYACAQLLGFHDLTDELLFRYARLTRGSKASKLAIQRCMNEAQTWGRDEIIAQCQVMMTSLCEKGEEKYAERYSEQAGETIRRVYGIFSIEYAELCSAQTEALSLLGEWQKAADKEQIALDIYKVLLGPGHLQTLSSHLKIAEYLSKIYKGMDTFEKEGNPLDKEGKSINATKYLQYGLKHAKGQKNLKLKASLYQLALSYHTGTIQAKNFQDNYEETGSLWYTQALIKEHGLTKFFRGYNQPHLMGPISFIFSDKARIKKTIKKYQETPEDFYKLLENYMTKGDYLVNAPVVDKDKKVVTIDKKKLNTYDAMTLAQVYEMKEAFLETLDK